MAGEKWTMVACVGIGSMSAGSFAALECKRARNTIEMFTPASCTTRNLSLDKRPIGRPFTY